MPDRPTRPTTRRLLIGLSAATLVVAGLVTPAVVPAAAAVAAPCGPGGNPVACENTLPGTPASIWDVEGAGDESIQGFATQISVDLGDRVDFKVDTDATAYGITIYRTGYYGGDGAREVARITPSASLPQVQPACITDVATELYDCGNWGVSASWTVPTTAVSGVYVARLERPDNRDASHITFIVRDDDSDADVVFQTSDPTWQAYNTYGGSNFYRGAANGRAYKISYNRPVLTRDGPGGRDFYFANEYPMVRFLEKNGYDVSYIAGVDTDRSGARLLNHDVFLSVGHDEYWSKAQRANVEAARDAGVHLQFLSGNEVYWKTRYEPSADASHTPYRTLVSYKETWDRAKSDPSPEWTGTWRDPRYAPPSAGAGVPENALTGTAYMVNYSDLPLTVTAAEGKNRLWRGTSVATQSSGSVALAPHTIGYESDEDVDNGFRPPGLVRLSTTTGPVTEYLQDFGNTVAPGTTTHHLTLYRAPSSALVFGAGTVQWTWGLDAEHDSPFAPEPADARMQQAQVNLFADMGVQPATLVAPLTVATASTDATGPTVTITTPAEGSARANGAEVTISGTATDAGGGRVAGVEYSTDSGTSWHPATGTSSWSATYRQRGQGPTPVRVRAIDDSANIGAPAVRSITASCPCTLYGDAVPKTPAATDTDPLELGIRFTPTVDGFVSGVRLYKGAGNGGTHVGSLWSASGTRLATATFAGETATGWQQVSFASSVPVTAGETYVASYTAPQGRFAVESGAFWVAGIQAPPLRVEGGFGTAPAGVYAEAGRFPDNSFQRSSYGVDVLFTTTDTSPLVLTERTPLADSTSVPTGTTVTARLSRAPSSGPTVTVRDPGGTAVAGTTSYAAATRTVTFTPSVALASSTRYTVAVTATDALGNPVQSGGTWSFTTARAPSAPGVCPCSLFDDSTQPTSLEDRDAVAVTLGVRFLATVAGTVTGVRFYKGPNNTGTHTGVLWSTSGTRLAQGTFTGESVAGWQTLTFAQPVVVTAGTEYVASYRTTAGKYSATPGQFSSEYNRPPLRVPRNGGAYSYADAYPGNTSGATYLVDVVFERSAAQVAMVAQDPAPGAGAVPRWSPVRIQVSAPLAAGWNLAVTRQSDGSVLPGTTALDAAGTTVTFTPTAAMPADVDVRAQLTGAVSTDGAVLPTQSWTFRTRAADPVTAQTLFSDHVPRNAATTDTAAVEVGTAFRVTKPGSVTALRFYKGPDNTGTHTGSLWTSSGTRLATVTFTGESATGWQSATLATPVQLTAGELYVVSYLAPNGHYASTPGFFSGPFTSGDLTAPAQQNGRFRYGAGGGFPTNDYGAANYFVDVVFAPTPVTVTVAERVPAPAATGVSRGAAPAITLSAPVADGYAMSIRQGSTGLPATVTRSADGRTLRLAPASLLPANADLTVSVTGVVSTEGAVLPAQTWTFRTEGATPDGASMFAGLTPAVPAASDSGSVELGTVFTPAADGAVTQVRFYKGTGNGGTHVGSLWTSTGTRLASVTFSGETATGWQTATFSTPVPVTAGQTYVVSYLAPQGRYSVGAGFFATAWTAGQLTAPAGQNGRYLYGAAGGFPTGSYNSSNYYVDVTFRAATSPTSGIAAPSARASAAGRVEYGQGPDTGSDRGTRDDDERATTRPGGSGTTAAGSSGRGRVLGAEPGPQLPVQRRLGAGRRLRPGRRPRRGPRRG